MLKNNKEHAYYCNEGCGFVKDNNHRCEQWTSVIIIPMRALLEYKEKGDTCLPKVKSKPIIKKSGGTFVAFYDGKNYLLTEPKEYGDPTVMTENKLTKDLEYKNGFWVSFSDLEITDEISKSRPLVYHVQLKELQVLYGVDEARTPGYITNKGESTCLYYRLATVKDIEDEL